MLDQTLTLPEDPEELRSFTARLLAEVKAQAILIEKLRHQLAGHRAHRFGASSETAEQLLPLYGTVGRLLSLSLPTYRVRWSIDAAAPAYVSVEIAAQLGHLEVIGVRRQIDQPAGHAGQHGFAALVVQFMAEGDDAEMGPRAHHADLFDDRLARECVAGKDRFAPLHELDAGRAFGCSFEHVGIDHQAHEEAGRVPAGGGEATEDAGLAGFFREMHGLRIEFGREFDDLF